MLLALIGLLLTVIWLLGGVWYVAEAIGFENLLFLLPSELGQMAIGFLLPLVLLWLVLGYLHIGNRLRRLEETLWEIAALRPARSGGGSPPPDDQGWLDLESEEQQGRAAGGGAATAAPASLRSRRPFAGAGGASMAPSGGAPSWAQRGMRAQPAPAQPTPTQFAPPQPTQPTPAEPPRRAGLASEIFSSRMRDRLAEEQSARPRDFGTAAAARSGPAQSAAPQAASSKRSAAKPPPMKPTLLQTDAANPIPERAAPQRPGPQKRAAERAEWQKPSSPPPPEAANTEVPQAVARTETPQGAEDDAQPATPQQPEPVAALKQETPVAAPKETSEAPAEPRPAEPVAVSAQQAPAPAPEQSGPAESNETPENAPEPKSGAAPAANAEAAAPAAKPVGFRHLVRITSMELNTIAMDLAGLLCRDADHAQALKGYDKGQKDVFFDLLSEQLSKQKPADALKRLQSAGGDQLMVHYLRKFDALVTESKGVDRSGALAKSLEAMPIGRLNTRLQALRAETW